MGAPKIYIGAFMEVHSFFHGISPWNECRWISMFEETLNGLLMD
jgi:hypothetical protein